MSKKSNHIEPIQNYNQITKAMNEDLTYRLLSRHHRTSLGRPLYLRINVQIIITQECPYHCPFCLERKHPMTGHQNFEQQIIALKSVLHEHPDARVTITGGEPSLYPEHVQNLVDTFHQHSNNTFITINTTGHNEAIKNIAPINLSANDYVSPDLSKYPDATYQTVLNDENMTIDTIIKTIQEINSKSDINKFSFRFLTHGLDKHEYPIDIWNDLQNHPDIQIGTFRIGDFFVYATFDYKDNHCRVTLGDMYQQQTNDYQDGYSNIIIHPDGHINTNWK